MGEGSLSGRAVVEVEMVEVTAERFDKPDEDMDKELEKYKGEEEECIHR